MRQTDGRTDGRTLDRYIDPAPHTMRALPKCSAWPIEKNSKTLNINYRSNTSLKWLEFTLCRASRPRRIFTVFVRKRLLTYLRIYSLNVNLTGTKEALSVFVTSVIKRPVWDFSWSSRVVWHQYEGRSINKLQNGAVSLFLKISEIRNVRYVAKFILEHPERIWKNNDDTVTSLKKVKFFPYSLPSVGPGADPGVQAVSPLVTWSESRHIPSSSLPLLSARPAFTFVAFTRWRYL